MTASRNLTEIYWFKIVPISIVCFLTLPENSPDLNCTSFVFFNSPDYDGCTIMFLRYDPLNNSYHHDLEGSGLICSAVDILPTEFAKEVHNFYQGICGKNT